MVKKLLIVLFIVTGVAAGFIGLGVYNIAADQPHWMVTEKLLDILRERAIEVRSEDLELPELDNPEMIAAGATAYDEMCVACHLAPDQSPTELHAGLYPEPPELMEHGIHDPREAFWVIKHGIKLTGMPAWGKSHSDEDIWAMVAFLQQVDGLSAEGYRQLLLTAPVEHGHGHEHAH